MSWKQFCKMPLMKSIVALLLTFSIASSSSVVAGTTDQSYFESLLSAASGALIETVANALDETDEPGTVSGTAADPFEKYNRMMFHFNSVLDEKALRPAAEKYREYTPQLVQHGVSNFFSNLGDVGVLTNSLLQGKFDQAVNDSTRLALNSIAGVGGVIDVATMLNYRKNDEDFGQTFGVWGVPEGPYIVLPVLGPRTVRSAVGTALDTYLQVETLGALSETAAGQDLVTELLSLNLVNKRSQLLAKTALLEQASLDPYVFTREAYLAYRRCQVTDCDRIDYVPANQEPAVQSSPGSTVEPAPDDLDLLDELD